MKITIVGGGFGGVKAALELAKDSRNSITLISDKTYLQYYPALYSAATGHNHLNSWIPLGEILADKDNVRVSIDTIVSFDPKEKIVTGESGAVYRFDRCIFALGSVTTYFNIPGLDEYAYGIKSAEEIQRLKHHLYENIAEDHLLDRHYVVIGAGPTGVELAAALGTYVERLSKHYGITRKVHVNLIEAAPRVLPRMSEATSKKVLQRLKSLHVNVWTNKAIDVAKPDEIIVSGKPMKTQTVIWTSGVANNPFYKANEAHFNFAKNGKIVVDEFMQSQRHVYVIGDNAFTPYSGLAQTALQDAQFVAQNILREHDGKKPKKYKASLPPVVVPVGKKWAAFEWRGIRLYGRVASFIRSMADLIGHADILPIRQVLGVWISGEGHEDDYFRPTPERRNQ